MRRYERFRRLAAVAACVGSTTAIAALGGAAPAMAKVKCDAGPLWATGSSFQGTQQKEFLKVWPTFSECETVPKITYFPNASGIGLEELGMGNVKGEKGGEFQNVDEEVLKLEKNKEPCGPLNIGPPAFCLDLYDGSDDAPTLKQNEFSTIASGGKTAGTTNRGTITVPTAEGPLAAMLSLPAGCKVLNHSRFDLGNVAWGQVFEGKKAPGSGDPGGIQAQGGFAAATWGALLTQLNYKYLGTNQEVFLSANSFTDVTPPEETLTRFKEGAVEHVKTATWKKPKKANRKK